MGFTRVLFRSHLDIDAPALALGRFAILPCREIVAARNDDDIGPSGVEIILAARLDHHILCGPEGIAIGKILLLAEQVADDLALVIAKVEQRLVDRKSTRLYSRHSCAPRMSCSVRK